MFPPGVQRDQAKGFVLWLLLACESLSQFSCSADAPAGWREQRSSGVSASRRPPPCQNQTNPFRECLLCKSAMHMWWDAATAPASSAEASILLALLLSAECCWSGGPHVLWGPSWPPTQERGQALCLAACCTLCVSCCRTEKSRLVAWAAPCPIWHGASCHLGEVHHIDVTLCSLTSPRLFSKQRKPPPEAGSFLPAAFKIVGWLSVTITHEGFPPPLYERTPAELVPMGLAWRRVAALLLVLFLLLGECPARAFSSRRVGSKAGGNPAEARCTGCLPGDALPP